MLHGGTDKILAGSCAGQQCSKHVLGSTQDSIACQLSRMIWQSGASREASRVCTWAEEGQLQPTVENGAVAYLGKLCQHAVARKQSCHEGIYQRLYWRQRKRFFYLCNSQSVVRVWRLLQVKALCTRALQVVSVCRSSWGKQS